MPATHRNRLVTAISNTPGASGALTIAAAASGYRTFGAADDGLSFDVSIVDGTAWEIRTGCVYTHATRTLTRGTLEDSSTGSAINLTSAAVVTVTMTAGMGNEVNRLLDHGFVFVRNDGTTVQAFASTASTKIASAFTTEVTDTAGWWDNTNKKFQPTRAGYYEIAASLCINQLAANNEVLLDLHKNGAIHLTMCRLATGNAVMYPQPSGTAVVYLNGTTDYVEIYCTQTSLVSRNNYAGINNAWFQARFIGD